MNNLKKIAKIKNKSLTSLSVDLEISPEAISQYISGKIKPKADILIKMAKILETSTDYLLDLTDNPNTPNFDLDEKENTLLNSFRKLSSNEKNQVNAYIQAILDLKNI